MREQPRGTVTLLLSDIEASTRLLTELGAERNAGVLGQHRALLRSAFETHGGYADGFDFINVLLGTDSLSQSNDALPRQDGRGRAALRPGARQAYGALDVDLMRNAAALVPLYNPNVRELTSSLVANVVFNPLYMTNLAALRPAP